MFWKKFKSIEKLIEWYIEHYIFYLHLLIIDIIFVLSSGLSIPDMHMCLFAEPFVNELQTLHTSFLNFAIWSITQVYDILLYS